MKKMAVICAVLGLSASMVFSMGNSDKGNDEITVISRESGSGTRGAFVELFGIEKKNAEGKKVDYTISTADISNSTEVVISSVKGNANAIGYISLGSLNNTVKALKIDGAEASVAAIKDGNYKISRPFNIVVKNELNSENAVDFIDFILSKEGQAIVENKGYIAVADNSGNGGKAYSAASGKAGKITVAGSSSVYPVMEKLAEAYQKLNPSIVVEVSQSDSGTGIASAISGVCDIGMASRDLKENEVANGIKSVRIAIDGVAVIVNSNNKLENLSSADVNAVYTGKISKWSEISTSAK